MSVMLILLTLLYYFYCKGKIIYSDYIDFPSALGKTHEGKLLRAVLWFLWLWLCSETQEDFLASTSEWIFHIRTRSASGPLIISYLLIKKPSTLKGRDLKYALKTNQDWKRTHLLLSQNFPSPSCSHSIVAVNAASYLRNGHRIFI